LLLAASAALLINVVGPAHAQAVPLDRATVVDLVKQVWAAGTWDQQEAAFNRLPDRARAAVWAVMTDVRPGVMRFSSVGGDAKRGPCQQQEVEECDYAPAPKPQPTAKPKPNPSRPPVVTPPTKRCTQETAYVPYEIAGEPENYAFVYAATLSWCYLDPSATGPLTDYTSFSFAHECCKFPWSTDPTKYVDKLVAQPATNTLKIIDHHTGWFEAHATLGPVSGGTTNAPQIDASVLADGSYVCG
jgi:hypothetical protein